MRAFLKTFLSAIAGVLVGAMAVVYATDGPLTPWANARGRTDENGYVLVSSGTPGTTDGPLTPFPNLRVRTDENGYLRVALTSGSLPSAGCIAWNADTWLQRVAAGSLGISAASCGGANNGSLNLAKLITPSGVNFLGIQKDSTHGVTLDVGTDAFVKFFGRDGSSAATIQAGGNLLLTDTGGTSSGGVIFGADTRLYRTSTGAVFIQPTSGTGGSLKIGDSGSAFVQLAVNTGSIYLDSSGTNNQTFRVNSQGTNALVLNGTTGAATFVSTVIAPSFTFNGTTGKTGATCSAFTAGGCTTSPEPTVYVTDYLMPWFSGAGYHIPTISEYADLRQQIAALTAEVSALKGVMVR